MTAVASRGGVRRGRAGSAKVPAPGSGPPISEEALRTEFELLSEEIRHCMLCPLARSRTHAVVYRGSLRPRLVFVGEAPGRAEDLAGQPFVGRSGRLLDRAIDRLGSSLGAYGVLNVLKCRPPENRFDPQAARTCRPYLDRQLGLLRPSALVPLGAKALAALEPRAPAILEVAGRPRRLADRWGFPLIHPAAALRSTRLHRRWDEDVEALGGWLRRGALETL